MGSKITVLMSVYNDSKYLDECIKSILTQTYDNFTFLIFDDASTDESPIILQKYAELDNRVKIIFNKENKGLSYNLARGVELADTDWIARMDADDIAFSHRLETQLKYVEENPEVDILGSYTLDINEMSEEIEIRKMPISHERISKLIWSCPLVHPTVIYKKSSIVNAGSYNKELRRRQDYELWFRCLSKGMRFSNIDEPLLYYRNTDEYYKKNNFRVQIQQLRMGLDGCKLVQAKYVAYLGVIAAFVKGSFPYFIRKPLSGFIKRFDPRRR